MSTVPVAIIGSTGLVGSNILTILLAKSEVYNPVTTITRRAPKRTSPALDSIVEADSSKWSSLLTGLAQQKKPAAVFSALGTTRAAAGGIDQQWKIDHDLNIEMAKAAKEAGASTYVFISSAATRGFPFNLAPYSKMKNGVEDAIKELDFEHGIIIKPAAILGHREEKRGAEALFQSAIRGLGCIAQGLQDSMGQDAEVIARAAVRAAEMAREGKAPSKYWELGGADIIKYGRTEWKDDKQ